MAKTKTQSLSEEAICLALRSSAEDYFRRLAKAHPGETPYAFLFEISCEGFSAHGALATEEGLARYSKDQLSKVKPLRTADPLCTIRSAFRWAGPEDGWYQQPDSAFNPVNKLLRRAEKEALYEMYDGSLNRLCLNVLREMDAAGTFGKGTDRIVLGICYIGGANSDEEFLGWAKQVNPAGVMKRLRQELKQSRKALESVSYF